MASTNPKLAHGVHLYHSDGQGRSPSSQDLTGNEIEDWFCSHPDLGEGVNVKILACRVDGARISAQRSFRPAFEPKLIEHAIWNPDVYCNLVSNPSGSAAALLGEPVRFVLQTPLDGGPFCSLAMSKKGTVVKGIYAFDHEDFEPSVMGAKQESLSGWRSSGFQIINMPQAILRAHSAFVSAHLSKVIDDITKVEHALLSPESCDMSALARTLHACSTRLIDLERRSRFERTVIAAIEVLASSFREGRVPWPAIAPQKSVVESREFDFESLPRRIANARSTIAGIIQQRHVRMNLQIANATMKMTEIALSDNASMKTIAVMTMIFLPGTAVASFFSMAMFDWTSEDGSQIVSKWLWIYFVIVAPLTVGVVAFWWYWALRVRRQRRRRHAASELIALARP